MSASRISGEGVYLNQTDGSDGNGGDANSAYRMALRTDEMTTAPDQATSDVESSEGQSLALPAEPASVPTEIFAASNLSTGYSFDLNAGALSSLAGRASGQSFEAAFQSLELDMSNLGKLQFGLSDIFAEAMMSVGGLAGDERHAGLVDFTSSNTAANIVDGMIAVDVVAKDGNGAALQAQLEALGLQAGSAYGAMTGGYLPIDSLDELAALDNLAFARPVYTLSNVGLVTGQPVQSMNVDLALAAHPGIDGTGITVGVISNSFDKRSVAITHYAQDVTNGDLPAGVVVLSDPTTGTGATDEGRAMAQAVYDIAPGVHLAFSSANPSMAAFANSIVNLSKPVASGGAGADIVVDDVIYFAEPMFQDGIIAQAVAQAHANGAMYFSSAGNQTTSSWVGTNMTDSGVVFNWTGSATPANNGLFHLLDFDPSASVDFVQTVTQGGATTWVFNWDQASLSAGGIGSASDLAIFLFLDPAHPTTITNVVQTNNIGGDALEAFSLNGGGSFGIAIGVRDGNPMPGLVKWVGFGTGVQALEYPTYSGTSFGHSNATDAVSVGASDWADSPRDLSGSGAYVPGQPLPYEEAFSSKGGTPILFDNAGARLATPVVRTSVDLTASDGGNNSFFGSDVSWDPDTFPNFYGTSQAAPNAAAVAALLMQAFPTATNDQVEAALKLSALDVKVNYQGVGANAGLGTGYDLTSGTGLIQADAAFTAMATVMANTAPVIGTADLVGAVTELTTPIGNLVDTGTVAFSDADGAQPHVVTIAVPTGGVIGALSAVVTTDTSAGGTGGLITWTYTLSAAAAEYLAAGESKVDTFTFYLNDQHGSTIPIVVNATVSGTEDAPVISIVAAAPADSAAKTLAETNAALTSAGTLTVTDVDYSNTVTPSVQSVAATGVVLGLTSDSTAQKAWMTVTPPTITANVGETHNLNWSFNSGAQAFNYLAVGESLILTYQLQAADNNATPGTATQAVAVTITGTNDTPTISLVTTDSASATFTETNSGLTQSGTLTAVDPDLSDTLTASVLSVAASGTTTGLVPTNAQLKAMLALTGTPIAADTGTAHNLAWNFNSVGEAFNYLNTSETLTLTYVVQVDDGHTGTTTQNLVVTVNGSGDPPVISVVVPDSATPSIAETNATLATSGTLTVVDPDMSDSVAPSVVSVTAGGTVLGLGSNNAALKAMLSVTPPSIGADSGATHNLAYAFNSGSEVFNYLDDGESLTLTYVVRATDTTGLTADKNVTVTITGTNDAPTLGLVSPSDSDSASLTDGNSPLLAHGTLTVVDPDLSDSVAASVFSLLSSPAFVSGFGMLTVLPSHAAADPGSPANLTWQFNAGANSFDYLAAGETQSLTYGLLVTDDSGATATKTVSITIHGVNEAPNIVGSLPASTAVVELPDHDAGENVATLSGTGTISYTDTDVSDTHSAGVVANGSGYLGSFTLGSVNQGADTVGWTFSVGDAALNSLGQGVVVHQSYTVTVNDGHSGTSSIVVGVDLIGSNDAAILSSANVVVPQGAVPISANGLLTITDEDNPALFQVLNSVHGNYGSLSLTAAGAWSYVADSAFTSLTSSQALTDSFTVHAVDGTPTTVSVTIAGSNDIAVARMDAFTTNETTTIGSGLSLFADNGSGADMDPDSPLQIAAVNGDPAFLGHQLHLASGALLTVNANGTFSYNPNHAFDTLTLASGAVNQSAFDSFTYTLAGGSLATVLININAVNNAPDLLMGSAGDNVITGFDATGDTFRLEQGGHDTAYGLGGNDGFYFGATLDSGDTVNGAGGNDTVALQGNTNATLGNITNVEVLLAVSGSDPSFGDTANNRYSYNLTSNDANVAAGQTLTVIGSGLLPGENLSFDGSAETDGNFRMFAGQGVDHLTGGGGSDGFFFGADGNLTGADRVNGGGGVDSLVLRGNYVGPTAVVMQNASMTNVEVMAFLTGHSNTYGGPIAPAGFDYDVTMADGNVAAGQRLDVIGTSLGADESLRFDGRAETDGAFRILSGAGDDTLWGGSGNDMIYGALGADRLIGGAGADTYVYLSAAESTSTGYDTIVGFDYHVDRIDVPGGGTRSFNQAAAGNLSTASFDSDLAAGMTGVLGAGGAALFAVTGGTLSGHVFAVIDANGIAGYQAGQDLVIELVNPVVPIDPTAGVIM